MLIGRGWTIVPFAAAVGEPLAPCPAARDIDWNAVVTDLRPRLMQIAVSVLGDHHGAEDAVQDALLRAWRNAHGLRDLQAFPAWIRKIVERAAIDRLRSAIRNRNIACNGFDEDRHVPHPSASRHPHPGAVAELADEMRRLPASLRSAVALSSLGHDVAEIAALERIGYGAAKTRLSRARGRLRVSQ